MKKILGITFVLILFPSCYSQLMNNNWYYGYGAGLNFDTSPPTSFGGINCISQEASNAVSDRNSGALLYYTNSDTIYDANNNPMPNGMNLMGGGHSSYQGVISVPDPADTNRYYVFSVGDASGTSNPPVNWILPYGGFAYHIVDMTMNGGSGDVFIRDQIIKQIFDSNSNKWFEQRVTAAPHCNGTDYWIVVRREDSLASSPSLYAYQVTATGVQAPVISNGGFSVKGFGGMKFSPDGSKFAFIGGKVPPVISVLDPMKIEVFDFDNSNGTFTFFDSYDAASSINTGLSFSPNSQFVYFSGAGFTSISGTYQIDLTNSNPATNSVQITTATPNSMHLARDGIIYMPAGAMSNSVNAIMNPDLLGPAANYTAGVVSLTSGQSWTGICNTIDAFLINSCGVITANLQSTDTVICEGDCIDFLDLSLGTVSGWSWSFPGSATPNSNLQNPTNICYNNPGSYDVELIVTDGLLADTMTLSNFIIVIALPAAPNVGTIDSYCEGDNVELTAIAGSGGIVTWYSDAGLTNVVGTGTTLNINLPAGLTTYYVTETLGTCEGPANPVDIIINPNPVADAGADATIFLGTSITLNGSGGSTYSWSPTTGLSCSDCSNPIATPLSTTVYVLTVSDFHGCSNQDYVTITVVEPETELFIPNVFSPNGDDHNDFFVIEGSGLNEFNIKVFNRWGQMIFESEDQNISWDGLQNGKQLNIAVFAYTLTFTDSLGDQQVMSGNVTLIK